jgi:putative hydroxymethylpyrimidine transport system substrate-binding protein
MKGLWTWAMGLLMAVLVLGCGGGGEASTTEVRSEAPKEQRQLRVTLDGWLGPENAGMLMARERGYFADLGPEPAIWSPARPERPINYVAFGTDDLGISHEPEVVLAQAAGRPVVIIGSLISQPTAAMIWTKKSGIHDVSDLKGKTIAYPGLPFQERLLEKVLETGGLTLGDVTLENVGYELVPALVGGQADAIFGGSGNMEGAELESSGVQPVVTPVQDFGIPAYDELVVIARESEVSEEPALMSDFMSAVVRGTAAAAENPKTVFNALSGTSDANPETSGKALRAQIQATNPLFSDDGSVDPAQAESLVDWMYEEGIIEEKVSVETLLKPFG